MLAQKKKILFAVLNWGLGHATRSWKLINDYVQNGDEVILASDGVAKDFLSREFPELRMFELPSYNAEYGVGNGLFAMMKNGVKTQLAVRKEKKWLDQFLIGNEIDLIISDNRYGIYSDSIKSVIITHQLNIKAPFGSSIVNTQNHNWLNRFNEVWVPDRNHELSGELSHPVPESLIGKVKEIGWLSRFEVFESKETKDKIVAIVSGPEPQKTILKNQLKELLLELNEDAVLYTGDPKFKDTVQEGSLTIKSHAETKEFFNDLISAKVVIGRSGYSSLMDYKLLNKKMILIPTPGQDEQLYLGNHLSINNEVTLVLQKDLNFATFKEAVIG